MAHLRRLLEARLRKHASREYIQVLRLPTMLREYDKLARTCAVEKANFPNYLLRLTELELLDRDRRATALVGELIEARDEKRLLRFLSRFD